MFERLWYLIVHTNSFVVAGAMLAILVGLASLVYLMHNLAALRRVARRIVYGDEYRGERYNRDWMDRQAWEDTRG